MYKIKVEGHFSSAHSLRGYKGKCEALHGHNWKVQIELVSDKLDKTGMLMDFALLKKALRKTLERLDHKYLNRLAYFKKVNPTSENIAKYVFNLLKSKAPGLKAVTIWESENSQATYEE